MKKILPILFLVITINAQSQVFAVYSYPDCGDPIPFEQGPTEWETIDTLGNASASGIRDWVVSSWAQKPVIDLTLGFDPCKEVRIQEEQYRICRSTGIRQVRYKTHGYYYLQTEYQKIVNGFKKSECKIFDYTPVDTTLSVISDSLMIIQFDEH